MAAGPRGPMLTRVQNFVKHFTLGRIELDVRNEGRPVVKWVALVLALAAGLSPVCAQELEPAMDIPAPAVEQTPPPISQPALSGVRNAIGRVATVASPGRVATQIRTNYADRRFYATDYTEHSSPVDAISHSFKPLDMGTNIRASLRNGTSPIALVGTLIGPMSMELERELVNNGRISPTKLIHAMEPGAIVGGLAGGISADVLGAAAQSALAGTMGPVGPVLGFLARPMIGYSAFLIGSNFGRSVAVRQAEPPKRLCK